MSRSFIKLHSGKRFYYDDVMTNEVDIEDVACGLAHACRYNGQLGIIDDYYSVAEHSVHVSMKVEQELRDWDEVKAVPEDTIRLWSLCGLLHDASEAFMGDMVSPLKKLDTFYKKKEAEVEALMARRFNTPFPFPRIIKEVDMKMFACEYPQVFPNDAEKIAPFDIITIPHDGTWDDVTANPHPYPELELHFYGPRRAYTFFMKRFKELGGK